MRTTLTLDDDIVAAARELAALEGRSIGSVISELARRGLTPAQVVVDESLPVIRLPAGSPPITPEMVGARSTPAWHAAADVRRRSRAGLTATRSHGSRYPLERGAAAERP